MSYATAADVEVELGRPASSTEETAQWEAWLDRVERAIVRRFVQAGLVLDDQIALDDPTLQDVVDVEVAAVIRKVQNPTWGLTSVTRSVDDASITERNEGSEYGDPLLLTDDQWFALLPGYSYSGAFSTRPGFEPDTDPVDSWV